MFRVRDQVELVPEGATQRHLGVVTAVDGEFAEVIWATSTRRPDRLRVGDGIEVRELHALAALGLRHVSYFYVDNVERPRHKSELELGYPDPCPPRVFIELRLLAEKGRVAQYDAEEEEEEEEEA